jgi:hypothetical protein
MGTTATAGKKAVLNERGFGLFFIYVDSGRGNTPHSLPGRPFAKLRVTPPAPADKVIR